ncbi:MAG: xanthine dehydrogenase family protein subunit M [Gammaproteobacteria bacterium]|nr:xanthine dehydrogenase family protein subunit M [Gammaproteobacteria bacterium]MDH4253034.1 xanthine dehydrogenase family protein subunit M [Gammaproteobacteria bacterium]MDH5308544.1 xanthine dehydrogenase family protein subunit M [Gammaproteobacteria bacterium]
MYEFNYHRPTTLAEAKTLLESNADAKLVSGGMTLLPTMKLRLARPTDLVDIGNIRDLGGIRVDAKNVEVGAAVRHAEVASSADVRKAIPALSDLAGLIGDPQVRNRGTLGGSIANSDPAADYPAAVLGLGATIRTDRREIAADDYFLGMFETALEPGEIVVAVRFPRAKRAAYAKFPNPASRYAVVGVFVAETGAGIRVAVTGAGACAFRVPEMETALGRKFAADSLDGIEVDAAELNGDLHASPEYRAHLVGVMARRAVSAAGG